MRCCLAFLCGRGTSLSLPGAVRFALAELVDARTLECSDPLSVSSGGTNCCCVRRNMEGSVPGLWRLIAQQHDSTCRRCCKSRQGELSPILGVNREHRDACAASGECEL